ncbi:unnamed protein product [Pleuronectes platessa]|uniref:Uncharacterized protein n=1 Tax=Pleuronectes platessa TaxID=8262 RepID=A0A9N7V9Y8_PLEPL|nr:unnamed protein product [Pleuronectes platessa]
MRGAELKPEEAALAVTGRSATRLPPGPVDDFCTTPTFHLSEWVFPLHPSQAPELRQVLSLNIPEELSPAIASSLSSFQPPHSPPAFLFPPPPPNISSLSC